MRTQRRVFEKLAENTKVELKSQKIMLSTMDEIEDALNRGFGLEEFVEEELDKAQEAMTKARDIIRFDMNDAYAEAEGGIDEAEKILNDLGASSDQLDRFKNELNQLERLIEDLKQKQESVG